MQAKGKTQDDLCALMRSWSSIKDTTTHIYWSCGWLCPEKTMEYWITSSTDRDYRFHAFLKYHNESTFIMVDMVKPKDHGQLMVYLKQYYPGVYARYIAETA